MLFSADAAQEVQRLAIATKQHVLAVVYQLAGLAIDERGGAAAKLRSCIEDQDPDPGVGQRGGGTQAGEAAADDDDVEAGGHENSTTRAQVVAAMNARRGRGMRIVVENTS